MRSVAAGSTDDSGGLTPSNTLPLLAPPRPSAFVVRASVWWRQHVCTVATDIRGSYGLNGPPPPGAPAPTMQVPSCHACMVRAALVPATCVCRDRRLVRLVLEPAGGSVVHPFLILPPPPWAQVCPSLLSRGSCSDGASHVCAMAAGVRSKVSWGSSDPHVGALKTWVGGIETRIWTQARRWGWGGQEKGANQYETKSAAQWLTRYGMEAATREEIIAGRNLGWRP
jgi:hypothetical protein